MSETIRTGDRVLLVFDNAIVTGTRHGMVHVSSPRFYGGAWIPEYLVAPRITFAERVVRQSIEAAREKFQCAVHERIQENQ